MDYIYHLITFIAFYTILASSLNLFSGYTGLLSLAHGGFYGVGAYTSALLSTHFGISPYFNNLSSTEYYSHSFTRFFIGKADFCRTS
ncbi:MAG: hypothetical protein IE881_09215 [Epsilonproteobacteria bacterium]|nr:hypothetical protein [Campylobacterota bacterium]